MTDFSLSNPNLYMQGASMITALYRYRPPYYKFRSIQIPNFFHDSSSRMIVAAQESKDFAIHEFVRQLDKLIPANTVICCVPSYGSSQSKQGIRKISYWLSNSQQRINGTHILRRTREDSDEDQYSSQTIHFHLESMEVNDADLVRNRVVVLLDDVIQSGYSLKAGAILLNAAGARQVLPYALGQA